MMLSLVQKFVMKGDHEAQIAPVRKQSIQDVPRRTTSWDAKGSVL